jgi:hypothetical protein
VHPMCPSRREWCFPPRTLQAQRCTRRAQHVQLRASAATRAAHPSTSQSRLAAACKVRRRYLSSNAHGETVVSDDTVFVSHAGVECVLRAATGGQWLHASVLGAIIGVTVNAITTVAASRQRTLRVEVDKMASMATCEVKRGGPNRGGRYLAIWRWRWLLAKCEVDTHLQRTSPALRPKPSHRAQFWRPWPLFHQQASPRHRKLVLVLLLLLIHQQAEPHHPTLWVLVMLLPHEHLRCARWTCRHPFRASWSRWTEFEIC